ncbi:hypothetical protein F8S09_08625 [Deinococcus sp. SDU3-2]|uniref:Uncharacterized protein n=1 Tax=Deinococcus terrestris TaxID=2651870 RepID=A0A7X1NWH1_9DEIO|nr:DUF6683 family protein [Deinococcus terrestris]MPY66754.1 hypothetical protein [Deinococcus terrestris]
MKRLVLGVSILLAGSPASAQSDIWWLAPPLELAQPFLLFAPELQPALQELKQQPPTPAPVRWVVPKLAPLTASEDARLSFTPSPERRQKLLNAVVVRWRAVNPTAADDFQQVLRRVDLFKVLADDLGKVGLRVNNVADAYAAYWFNAWETVNGVRTPGSRKQAQAVKVQVARAMLASGELGRATEAQKQEMAEELLIQAVTISAANEAVQGDLDAQIALAEAVDADAQQRGLDLSRMRLTDAGFAFPQ